MSFSLPAAARSQLPEVTTHFVLMTNLSRTVPSCRDDVPGLLLSFGHRLKLEPTHAGQHGGLLHGSSPVPLGFYAITIGRHAFYFLFNPLDEQLRPMMVAQRDASLLPCLVSDSEGQFINLAQKIQAHRMTLEDTEGRDFVAADEWLKVAEDTAPVMPLICGMANKQFAKAKWHHAYFVVPDAQDHPLYARFD